MIEAIKALDASGYCVIKNFLSSEELTALRQCYIDNQSKAVQNKNYAVNKIGNDVVAMLFPKLEALAKIVSRHTSTKVDLLTDDCGFPDNGKINFGWHQEHESYYKFQQLQNYINLYIPIIKEHSNESGLDIVPADVLKSSIPADQYDMIISRGAAHYSCTDTASILHDDVYDKKYNIDVSLNSIKHTPEILPGDLLLLRGNTIHRTQDTNSHRVAASIRMTLGSEKINKHVLLTGGVTKQRYIANNKAVYDKLLEYFVSNNLEQATAYEIYNKFHEQIKQSSSK